MTVSRFPALRAAGTPPGGFLHTDLYSRAGDLVILLLSAPGDRLNVPPFGDLWLDPYGIFFVDLSVQGPTEHRVLDIPIAPFATVGLPIAVQGLSGASLGLVILSTPSVVVLH